MPGDTEIEIKVKIDEKTFSDIREKLKEMGKYVNKIKQVDDYYTPRHRNFVESKFPYEWLRVGRRGNRVILNYKHFYPENVEITTHCDEFETEIQDAGQLEKILEVLNFKKLVTVDKFREIYTSDGFEIALDTVKDLGHYVEIEAKKDLGNVEETRKKLFEFAKNLGINTSNQDLRGYPYVMMQKKGFIK